jgi:hypothetical protein
LCERGREREGRPAAYSGLCGLRRFRRAGRKKKKKKMGRAGLE